jgi:hypothetical protein
MSVSVKIGDDHKQRLDRLREDLSRIRGEAVTAQEVLERLILLGSTQPDLLLRSFSRVRYPLPRARLKATLALAGDWMGETSEADIDRTLYGGRRKRPS